LKALRNEERDPIDLDGVIVEKNGATTNFASDFIAAIGLHRHGSRETVPDPAWLILKKLFLPRQLQLQVFP
jgi:hypothetical protein